MKPKILITGHRGLLGRACVALFCKKYDVVLFHGDLRNKCAVEDFFHSNRLNAVINCAAKVGGVKANRDNPVDFILDNLEIQNNVIECSADYGVEKLINVGTSCLFPAGATLPVEEESLLTGPFDESVSAYATAKLAGYALCKAYSQQHGKNFMTVCPSNIYGPGDNYGPSAHVIPALIQRLSDAHASGKPLVVWGDGSAIREFIYVDDAASAIDVVLDRWNKPDMINIGTGIGTSILDLVNTLIKITNYDVKVVWDTSQPTGIQRKTFSRKKIEKLGWGPTVFLNEGLIRTWNDFVSNPSIRCK